MRTVVVRPLNGRILGLGRDPVQGGLGLGHAQGAGVDIQADAQRGHIDLRNQVVIGADRVRVISEMGLGDAAEPVVCGSLLERIPCKTSGNGRMRGALAVVVRTRGRDATWAGFFMVFGNIVARFSVF